MRVVLGGALLLFLLPLTLAWETYNCTVPNDCTYTGSGYSYCREGLCRQCDPTLKHKDCDCAPDEYCVTDRNSTNWGFCANAFDDGIIGSACNRDLNAMNWESINETSSGDMFCGKIIYENGKPISLEWAGACKQGICHQCSDFPFPTIPWSKCGDGRTCHSGDGVYVIAPAGVISWSFFTHQPMDVIFYTTLVFGDLALLIMGGLAIYLVCLLRTRAKVKYE